MEQKILTTSPTGGKSFSPLPSRPLALTHIETLGDWLNTHGSPLFIVYERSLKEHYAALDKILKQEYPKSKIAYSLKTNPLRHISRAFKELGASIEVVSDTEYELAGKFGFKGKDIIFNGPHKSKASLGRAILEKSVINIDSKEEFHAVAESARELGTIASVGIRVSSTKLTREFKLNTHQTFYDRFGFTIENGEAASFCSYIKNLGAPVQIRGYHFHIATNIRSPKIYEEATRSLLSFTDAMGREHNITPEYIDLGGGFPDFSLQGSALHELGTYVRAVTKNIKRGFAGREPLLVVEPGRFLVSRSMLFATRVVSIKQRNAVQLVTIDGSISMLPRGIRHYPIAADGRKVVDQKSIVAGASCMGRDIFGHYILPKLGEGDILVFLNCGAYSIAAASQFIHARPGVLWVSHTGVTSIARRAETPEDILRLDR